MVEQWTVAAVRVAIHQKEDLSTILCGLGVKIDGRVMKRTWNQIRIRSEQYESKKERRRCQGSVAVIELEGKG